MMTRVPGCASWIAVALLVAACEGEKRHEDTPQSASAGQAQRQDTARTPKQGDAQAPEPGDAQAPEQTPESVRPRGNCTPTEPPTFTLTSLAGEQVGANGSYCGGPADPSCGFGCADRAYAAVQFTIVHPGDELTISMPAGKLVPGPHCNPECPPTWRLQAICPRRAEVDAAFVEDVAFRVEVSAGLYTLIADSHLEGDEGWAGSSSGVFGLIVDADRDRAIVPADSVSTACASAGDAGPDASIDAAVR
jgi:hypothetical protein